MPTEASPYPNVPPGGFAWFDALCKLREQETLGPAVLLAYEYLWRQVEAQPGPLTITPHRLGSAFGRDPRTARGWLFALTRENLIQITHRPTRKPERGKWTLYIEGPSR